MCAGFAKEGQQNIYHPPTIFKWSIKCFRKIEDCEESKAANPQKLDGSESIGCTAAAEYSLMRELGSSIISDNSKSALYRSAECCRSLKEVMM
jgi:hypothetical protein